MKILVNGKEAVLKAGSSFEYVSENPLFTEAEDYSLEIEFPMKDCPQNILIFGALHVKGVDVSTVTFPCQITTESFNKSGILIITEVNDASVKAQFLEGMSQENYSPSAGLQVYLNDLDFSAYDGTAETQESVEEVEGDGWEDIDVWDSTKDVGIPAEYNAAGYGRSRCRHIYLYRLVELVSELVGYSFNVAALESIGMYRDILLVNVTYGIVDRRGLYGYYDLERALPHWTVRQFVYEIGLFFGCVAEVREASREVIFRPYADIMAQSSSFVSINPLDDYQIEFQDGEEKYRGNVGLKLPGVCNPDNVNMCPWFVNLPWYYYNVTDTTSTEIANMLIKAASGIWEGINFFENDYQIYNVEDKGVYAIVKVKKEEFVEGNDGPIPDTLTCIMECLNQYGDYREGTELGIVPCPTEIKMIPDGFGSKIAVKYAVVEAVYDSKIEFYNNDQVPVTPSLDLLKDGEKDTVKYYDKLWCVLCDGNTEDQGNKINTRKVEFIAGTVTPGGDSEPYPYSRRIKEYAHTLSPVDSDIQANASLPKVDETKLYRYKFLASPLPSATAIYVIKGKRYACLRLTAHFTTSGMSELIEGEFYEIVG